MYSLDLTSFKFLLGQDYAVAGSIVDNTAREMTTLWAFCTLLYFSVLLRYEGRFYADLSYS